MTHDEFLLILDNDEFLNYLKVVRGELRKDLRFDFETGRIGSCSNSFHNGQYEMASSIMDNYIYFLEKKYKIGRGVGYDK